MSRFSIAFAVSRRRPASFAAVGIAAGIAACLAVWSHTARSADAGSGYPNRPIHMVVPFGAGTQSDIAARILSAKMEEQLGQPVVVDNRPGASTNIGSEIVAKAPPDGYTLLLAGSLITLLPSTMGKQAVDPVTSFAPVIKFVEPPIVIIANPSLGVSTLPELVALARKQPGKIAYATTGVGTVQHLIATMIATKAGIEMLHVPYVNAGQALKDVVQGEVPVYLTFLAQIDAQLKSGQLRALAVTSERRLRTWPDVPTVAEVGYKEAAVTPWNGFLAPAGTPPEIIDRLFRVIASIVQQPEVMERFTQMGMEPTVTPPDRFEAEIREAVKRWPAIVRAAGITPQ
jgi:tripartite-type tricarboxylate transporter receptor subunit TctC